MSPSKKFKLVLLLGMLTAVGPFSIDMYLPSFPGIAASLHTSVARITLSLSSFFVGIAFGQMFYGPLLDKFGRKKPLYLGLMVYIIASLGCALAINSDQLIWLRLLQALGSCSGLVAARAMVRDLFPVEDNAKVFSSLMLVVGVSPIIAPTLGGYFTAAFGWHSIFIFLAFMCLCILTGVHYLLPDSYKPDPAFSLRPLYILNGYKNVIKEPQFYIYCLTGSIAAAGLYAYIAGSPAVFMELFNVSEKQYGWIFAFVAAGLITSSQINSFLLRKYKSQQVIKIALIFQSLAGLCLFAGSLWGLLNVFGTIALCLIFLSCQGFIFPNTTALSLSPFTKTAGSASALLGSIQMAIGAFSSAMVSYFNNGSALPMTGVMALCAIISLIVLLTGNIGLNNNSFPAIKNLESDERQAI